MKQKISIVIPTFNRATTLGKAVESVISQTNENWELIIIDDGSIDETPKIVRNYLSDERISYFYQDNHGVSVARNTGVKLSNGEYVIFLDSDDVFFPNMIQSVFELEFFKYDLICWQVLKIIDGKSSIWKPQKMSEFYGGIVASFLSGSICYRKSLFLKVGGFDNNINFGENYELGLRISQIEGLRINIIDRVFLKYEIRTLNRVSNCLENRLNSYIYQYKKHKTRYDKYPIENSEINYLIGFVLEKSNKKNAAFIRYKTAWLSKPSNLKSFLKMIYLKCFK